MTLVNVNGLQAKIVQAISDYTEAVEIGIEKEIERTAKATVKDVKAASPVGKGKDKGKYRDGWSRKKSSGHGKISYTIYNKYKGPLVHLLCLGFTPHGATERVPGRPHLRPAAEKNIAEMNKNIDRIIREGG